MMTATSLLDGDGSSLYVTHQNMNEDILAKRIGTIDMNCSKIQTEV